MTSDLVVAVLKRASKVIAWPGRKWSEQELDLVGDGEAVVDDVAEVVGFLEAFQDVLKGADEIENGDLGESRRLGLGLVAGIGLVGEAPLLLQLADGEETGGVLEFLILDELADEFPARVIVLRVLLREAARCGGGGCGT